MPGSQSDPTALSTRNVTLPTPDTYASSLVTNRPTKAISFDVPAASSSMTEIPRYPKRKRSRITYNEVDEDDFMLPSNVEEDYEPKLKKQRKSGKPLPKHKIFPFMELPAELRNRVYGFSLSDNNGGIYVTSMTKGYRRIAKRCTQPDCFPQFSGRYRGYRRYQDNGNDEEEETPARTINPFVPNILAVSKTVYAEAASFLYGQRISFADNYTLLSFLNQIGRQHTSMLREICIKKWCSGRAHRSINFPAMTLLASATNLETLDIDCAMGHFLSYGHVRLTAPIRAARKAFRDCYPWLEAIGNVRGRPDAAIELMKVHPSNFAMRSYNTHSVGSDEEKLRDSLACFQKELRRLLRT